MTQEQHEQFTKACLWFGEQLEKIFSPGSPTIERQDRGFVDKDGTWTVTNNCKVEIGKGWEILELKDSTNADYDLLLFEPGNYITRDKQLTYRFDHVLDFVKTKQWTIHSVRRLPDNSVWTIGDNTSRGVIKKFTIIDGTLFVYGHDWNTLIRTLMKPEPIFTTADGVGIFDPDIEVFKWFVTGEVNSMYWVDISQPTTEKWYSTREEAEEAYNTWAWNESVLSCEEAVRLLNASLTGDQLARLKLFVKDKIAKR